MIPEDRSYILYDQARDAMDRGEYTQAIGLFKQSLDCHIHFKAFELIGDCYMQLGEYREAILPLAAATGLNRGSRAPYLLALAFKEIGEIQHSKVAAENALARNPDYKKAAVFLERFKQ